jgi:hypothetical protein
MIPKNTKSSDGYPCKLVLMVPSGEECVNCMFLEATYNPTCRLFNAHLDTKMGCDGDEIVCKYGDCPRHE